MIIELYVLRDRVGNFCHPPEVFRTDAAALRAMEASLVKYGAREGDFEMRCVGTFDDTSGDIFAIPPRVVIPSVDGEETEESATVQFGS